MTINDDERFVEDSYIKLFLIFLRYGFLAWGGPIAQLALIEREMVYQKKLLSVGYFNRLIAIYQAFPGPETHEICVHLGTQAKGPLGGLLAGLGFMMPGFILMMFLSWLYVLYGITALVTSILLGIKPAVIAWIVKGGIQLGRGILLNSTLWSIAITAFFAEIMQVHFIITFLVAGVAYVVLTHPQFKSLFKAVIGFIKKHIQMMFVIVGVALLFLIYLLFAAESTLSTDPIDKASLLETFLFGLKCGSLSFGSVYSILSIIKTDAIVHGHWLTQTQFIDGLTLAGALPAPFIIVTTFVGYMAYGFWGGILSTLGTFLIPFLIPMFGYKYLNRIALNQTVRTFLDGVTAAVAGLIAADMIDILSQVLINKLTIGIFLASLVFIHFYKSHYAIVWIVIVGGLLGVILM